MNMHRIFPSVGMIVAWLAITTLTGALARITNDSSTAVFPSDNHLENAYAQITQSPDFTLAVNPPELSVCTPSDANYTVDVGQIQGFTDPVTLYPTQQPAGSSANFSLNPVIPPNSSTLTIGNTGVLSAGIYPIIVAGTAPTVTHEVEASLIVYTNPPGIPILQIPLDTESDVPLQPTFYWSTPSQGGSYDLDVALDSRFTNIVIAETGLQQTHFSAIAPLNLNTIYYWRIRSVNTCGVSGFSNVSSFTTRSSHAIYLPVVVRY